MTDGQDSLLGRRSLGFLALSVALVLAALTLGQLGTFRALFEWYPDLKKPFFTPPNSVFPIVWPILYALMAFAFWRILREPAGDPERTAAVRWFLIQLTLNALWSWAFFAARNPAAGLIVIILLEASILMTMARFWRLDLVAALCLAPYALWVAYAAALNAAIFWLN